MPCRSLQGLFRCLLFVLGICCRPLSCVAGRPVDVEVSKMGLFISDENAGAVYRVAYNASFDAAVAALAPQQINPYDAGPP